MIIRFAVQNYKSLRDRNEISFVASKLSDPMNALIHVDGISEALLPTLAVYGANASGKSNLLAAIEYMREVVRWSHRAAAENVGMNRRPFRLDSKSSAVPSSFDIDFIVNNVRYHYGFTCDDKVVLSEWLFAYPKKKRQVWLFRERQNFEFGSALTGRNKIISEQVGESTLFLSAAAANRHDLITPIFRFFTNDIYILGSSVPSRIVDVISDDVKRDTVIRLLSSADFGIKSAKIADEDLGDVSQAFSRELTEIIKKHVPGMETEGFDLSKPSKKVMLGHGAAGGDVVYLESYDESSGTLKMLELLGPILESLDRGSVLIIDEIDSSLHSAVSTALVKVFSDKVTNNKGAQLFFSTHDTNLLCSGGLRRDQIWFAEKSSSGATITYPLTDIVTRKGDNLERGYLQGRYGAIPFIGGWESLLRLDAAPAISVGERAV